MMKNRIVIIMVVISGMTFLMSCQKKKGDNVVPDNLKVGVSDAISFPDLDKKKSLQLLGDTLSGQDIYQTLRTLVYISDFASDMIQGAVDFIRTQDISGPVSFNYTSPDDGNVKYLEVQKAFIYQKQTWDFGLTVMDEIEGKALLVVWNNTPLEIIAVLHPMAWDVRTVFQRKSLIRVEYHDEDPVYDRTMTVSISGLDSLNIDYISKMKIFFGQKGDEVELFGDINMPYTFMFDPDQRGRSWCFKARNNVTLDIAVAKVAMPRVTLANTTGLWTEYALDKVMETEMTTVFPTMDSTVVQSFLSNARGVAYFIGRQGFVSNDTNVPAVSGFTPEFMDLTGLNPWPPAEVEAMTIEF